MPSTLNCCGGTAGRGWPAVILSAVLVGALLLTAPLPARAADARVDRWVARCLAAHGGEAALRRVRTIVWQGTIERLMARDRGRETIFLKRPLQLRTLLRYPRSREDRILAGEHSWRDGGRGFQPVTGPPRAAMVFQYRHLTLPLGLLDPEAEVSWAGGEGEAGPVVLKVTRTGEPPMRVEIDRKTGLIRRVGGLFRIGEQRTELAVAYGDYREVEGVRLPHRIVNFAGGMKISQADFPKVVVNSALPAATFSPELP